MHISLHRDSAQMPSRMLYLHDSERSGQAFSTRTWILSLRQKLRKQIKADRSLRPRLQVLSPSVSRSSMADKGRLSHAIAIKPTYANYGCLMRQGPLAPSCMRASFTLELLRRQFCVPGNIDAVTRYVLLICRMAPRNSGTGLLAI
jgi:hypothetical protein